jgi:hypothetical protein
MRGPEGFSGGGTGAEVWRDPEVTDLLGFLDTYKKIQEILSWLVESSATADPVIAAVRRGHMHQLMQQLGLDPGNPGAFMQLEELRATLSGRAHHPEPRIEVPDARYFRSRIKEIISDQEGFGIPHAQSYATSGTADIVAVARYGHTGWADVKSRTSRIDAAEWVHGIARVMADPVAYHAEFGGLGTGSNNVADHIVVGEDWSIQNGRHRALAAASLGEDYLLEAGMAQWIPVNVEEASSSPV